MAIFDWFRKKEPENYAQVLESLALDIQKRQSRLNDIRLRERRTTLLITFYTIAIWAAYVVAWYIGWRPMNAIPIVVGPIIIQFSRRIAQTWYKRIENAEEKTLKELLSQQRNKVEEIKKKTDYYSMRNLIERYDSPTTLPGSPLRAPNQPQQKLQSQPTTPQRVASGQPIKLPQVDRGQTPNMAALGRQPCVPVPQIPLAPPRKQWFDRIADVLLGDDEQSADGAKSRYALVCQKCFAHNGLVKEELWEDTQYLCPKCGYFNPSMRDLKSGAASRSPTSPQHQSQFLQTQRRNGPRMSAPTAGSGPLLRVEELGNDRRRSLPALDVTTLTDEEEDRKPRTRRSPLAQNVSLPDDGNVGDGEEENGPEVEEVDGLHRRRRIVVADD